MIHWIFILLYAYGIFKQLDDISELENSGLLVFEVFFAIIFLIIVIMRYSYMRRFETFLGAREPIPSAHKYLAKTIHICMYLCLIILPISGLLIAALFTQGITDGAVQDLIIGIHGFSADLSYVLIAIHIGAALYSRIKGEGVWTSMVPIWKENKPVTNKKIIKIKNLENNFFEKVEDIFSTSK
ncbi:MAG: cytochrome B [Euryarchaeota archaeon]|nr:cytochrome B [Euryarchaeota archaeon]MBK65140.1 cytochrome B [Euryarchaeota archaeon]